MQAWLRQDKEEYDEKRRYVLETYPEGPVRDRELAAIEAWWHDPSRQHPAWTSRVDVHPVCQDAWEAFWDLDGDRQIVVMAGLAGGAMFYRRIPYLARSAWLHDHGYFGVERARMERLLRALDAKFCEAKNTAVADDEDAGEETDE